MKINWVTKSFGELSPNELYRILHLRSEVFVVEQDCVYQDMDFLDQKSLHILGWFEEDLVAYTRIIPPNIKFQEASIGRVVNNQTFRGKGLGKFLMKYSIEQCKEHFGNSAIKISAQCYLNAFYQSLDFIIISDIYLEDGIEHQEMIYRHDN